MRATINKLNSEQLVKDTMVKQTSKVYEKMQIKTQNEEKYFMDNFEKSVKKRE